MQIKSIPPEILVKVGACVLTLALLALAIVLPQRNRIDALHEGIAQAKADIQRQAALKPLYESMRKQLDEGLPEAIPPLREVRLTQDSITDIQGLYMEMAAARGVFPESISPDPSSLAATGSRLSVNCVFHGPLDALRGLLLDMGTLSSLHHVEQVSVREEGMEAMMQLKTWLTLE